MGLSRLLKVLDPKSCARCARPRRRRSQLRCERARRNFRKVSSLDQSAWIHIGLIRVEQRLELWGVH